MTSVDPEPAINPQLVNRVRNILLKPAAEWAVIDGETATIKGLYTGYVCLLAAIPAVAKAIGDLAFGRVIVGLPYHPSILDVLVQGIVQYLLSLAMIFVIALVIDSLAPMFGGRKDRLQAFKLAAFSSTALYLAGIFYLIPQLAPLAIIGLYSLYLFYLGVPVLMKPPQEKALAYTAVVIVVTLVLLILVGALVAQLGAVGAGPSIASYGR